MRIPKNLKSFKKKKEDALLLVTGGQDAVIYKASHGVLERVDTFKIDTPNYSDNEGKLDRAKAMRKRDMVKEFVHELTVHLKNIQADRIPVIYLFTPSYVKNQIMKALPTEIRKHVRGVIEGNYFHLAPSELLLKLA